MFKLGDPVFDEITEEKGVVVKVTNDEVLVMMDNGSYIPFHSNDLVLDVARSKLSSYFTGAQ